jgi:hypothetical protein
MRLKFYSSLFIGLLIVLQAVQPCKAQAVDTLRVMQYNLLHYGKQIYDCNDSNNCRDDKNTSLRIILKYAQPDIFAVNEMDGEDADAQYLLDHALNVNGKRKYRRAAFEGDYLVNTLFYNSEKLALKSQDRIVNGSDQHDINVYHLYYKKNLKQGKDTTFLTCFVVDLKAGEERSSERLRARETQRLMDYREENDLTGNVLVMGDFNVYDSEEEAFQNFVEPMDEELKLYDPINTPGSWHDTEEFAQYHTQSTHMRGDCAAWGGLDDRFDFILMSKSLGKGSSKLKYQPGSYEVLGQDGEHFDKELIDGGNETYDSELTQALYKVSDHLPVFMKIQVLEKVSSGKSQLLSREQNVRFNNPVHEKLNLKIDWGQQASLQVEVLSIIGKVVFRKKVEVQSGVQALSIPFSSFEKGMYLLKISDDSNHFLVKKVLKY